VRSNPPPEPGGADEVMRWYREEHLPRLCAVPGTLRARLYRADAGISGIVTAERQVHGAAGSRLRHVRDARQTFPTLMPGVRQRVVQHGVPKCWRIRCRASHWLDFASGPPDSGRG
jgi:hypothetical protein